MIKKFREFINRGSLVEIAVAFVMGVAFAAVIASFTNDIINPIIAKIFSVENLADWIVADIRIGAFLVAVINFLIVAFVMFLVVRGYNRLRAAQPPAEPTEEVVLLREIRDGLNHQA